MQAAKRAQYDEALSMLLDLGMVDGMSIAEYKRWCPVLWEVLERRARFKYASKERFCLHLADRVVMIQKR